eukprot:ctg_95.g113
MHTKELLKILERADSLEPTECESTLIKLTREAVVGAAVAGSAASAADATAAAEDRLWPLQTYWQAADDKGRVSSAQELVRWAFGEQERWQEPGALVQSLALLSLCGRLLGTAAADLCAESSASNGRMECETECTTLSENTEALRWMTLLLHRLDVLSLPTGIRATGDAAPIDLTLVAAACIREAAGRIRTRLTERPLGPRVLSTVSTIAPSTTTTTASLSPTETDAAIDALHGEYTLRRQLLVQRLLVSVDAFRQSQRARVQSGAYDAGRIERRLQARVPWPRFDLYDVWVARHPPPTIPGSQRVLIASEADAVKRILVGAMPDRGGRITARAEITNGSAVGARLPHATAADNSFKRRRRERGSRHRR